MSPHDWDIDVDLEDDSLNHDAGDCAGYADSGEDDRSTSFYTQWDQESQDETITLAASNGPRQLRGQVTASPWKLANAMLLGPEVIEHFPGCKEQLEAAYVRVKKEAGDYGHLNVLDYAAVAVEWLMIHGKELAAMPPAKVSTAVKHAIVDFYSRGNDGRAPTGEDHDGTYHRLDVQIQPFDENTEPLRGPGYYHASATTEESYSPHQAKGRRMAADPGISLEPGVEEQVMERLGAYDEDDIATAQRDLLKKRNYTRLLAELDPFTAHVVRLRTEEHIEHYSEIARHIAGEPEWYGHAHSTDTIRRCMRRAADKASDLGMEPDPFVEPEHSVKKATDIDRRRKGLSQPGRDDVLRDLTDGSGYPPKGKSKKFMVTHGNEPRHAPLATTPFGTVRLAGLDPGGRIPGDKRREALRVEDAGQGIAPIAALCRKGLRGRSVIISD